MGEIILNKETFLNSLYCRFDDHNDPDLLKGKWKDRYVYFYNGLTDQPVTKKYIKENRLGKQEIINDAMPKKSRIHISEYTGGLTNPRPDQVVYEDKCGAAVLMMEEVIHRVKVFKVD